MFMELYREEEKEEGDKGGQEYKRGEIKKGKINLSSNQFPMCSPVWNTQRGSQSYIEKRRGRREMEVMKRRRGGIKRGEISLASNQFPMCSPQSGPLRDVHGVP